MQPESLPASTPSPPVGRERPLRTVLSTRSALYLLGTSLVGRLPTAMSSLAIVQLVRLGGGEFAQAGAVTAVYIVAGAVGQPLLSRIVDRAGRTLVLVVSGVVSAGGFVAIALFAAPLPALGLAAAALAGLATPPLEPSLRTLWPRIVPAGAPLKAAFSLDAGAQEVMFIVGPLLTVVGIAAFGATGNMLFAAALGLVGTIAFAANPVSRREHTGERSTQPRVSPWIASRFRRIVVLAFAVGLPIGVLTIAATWFEEFHDLPGFSGWALAINAGGALIGATAIALRPLRARPERVLAGCGALLALCYLPLAFDLPPLVWLLAALVAGLMLPPTLVQVFEIVSSSPSPTEANAWVVSAMSTGIAAGTLGAGWVSGWASGPAVLAIGVGGAVVATAASALFVRPSRLD